MNEPLLRISEIFFSLQGESTRVGLPTIFIRLTGCPLRCIYCDSAYAFHGGKKKSISTILNEIQPYQTPYVCITGGEPLAQPHCLELMQVLVDHHYQVSLETSGAISCASVPQDVMIVMDLKTPDSQESHRNLYTNLDYLKPSDQIKFVLCSRADYEWAVNLIETYRLPSRVQILFSPSYHTLSHTDLADWILQDQLPVRLQLQMHKILWGDTPGR